MSTERDLLWYRTDKDTHFTGFGGLVAGTQILESVTANVARSVQGISVADSHQHLRGTIEHIGIVILGTVVTSDFDFIVYSRASADSGSDPDADAYIDHESFATGDFVQVNGDDMWHAAKSGLSLPYIDKDATKKFHFAIVPANTMTVPAGAANIAVEWCWRPDVGE